MLKVLIGAGGSGGHLFPAQQLARQLDRERVLFAGHGLEDSPFFEKERVPFVEISAGPLRRPFALWKGFWQSIALLRRFDPDVVVGFGSYHSLPILLAAAVLRKKIVLFEANCTPGKVNRLIRPFAHVFAAQFPQKKSTLIPMRSLMLPSKEEARAHYGLKGDLFTILVFGGSQGAQFLNELLPRVVPLLAIPCQVLHFTGKGSVEYTVPSVVKPFEPAMSWAYAAADVVVCRSGAGTVAELIQAEKPALLIPYPYAGGHQIDNGAFLARHGARMVLQSKATAEKVAGEIALLRSEEARQALRTLKGQAQGTELCELVRKLGE